MRVGTAAGDVVHQAELDRREQTISRAGGRRRRPTMVVFDDGNRLLKTLDFEQPTAWLATQLASDADLWSRSLGARAASRAGRTTPRRA